MLPKVVIVPDVPSICILFELRYWEYELIENYSKVAILFAGNILTVQGNYLHWRQPNDENEFIFSNQSHLIFMIIYCTLKREAVHMWPTRICTYSYVPRPCGDPASVKRYLVFFVVSPRYATIIADQKHSWVTQLEYR